MNIKEHSLITIELLSEVLDTEVTEILNYDTPDENYIQEFWDTKANYGDGLWIDDLNKYEFLHKCKDYIWKNGFSLSMRDYIGWEDERQGTLLLKPKEESCGEREGSIVLHLPLYQKFDEFEAVVKTTLWVIENKSKEKE